MEKLKEEKWLRSLLIILCRTFYSFIVTYSFTYRLGIILDMFAFSTFQCLLHDQLLLHPKFFQSGFSWWLCDLSVSDKFTEVVYPTKCYFRCSWAFHHFNGELQEGEYKHKCYDCHPLRTNWCIVRTQKQQEEGKSEQSIFHFSHWNLLKCNVLISIFRWIWSSQIFYLTLVNNQWVSENHAKGAGELNIDIGRR